MPEPGGPWIAQRGGVERSRQAKRRVGSGLIRVDQRRARRLTGARRQSKQQFARRAVFERIGRDPMICDPGADAHQRALLCICADELQRDDRLGMMAGPALLAPDVDRSRDVIQSGDGAGSRVALSDLRVVDLVVDTTLYSCVGNR